MSLLKWMASYVEELASKAETRILRAVKEYDLPVFVSFSGGKDSAAALAAAVGALGASSIVGYFIHIPGQTITDNVVAARQTARELGLYWRSITWKPGTPLPSIKGTVYHVIQENAPYFKLLREKGPPAPPPRPRWCCRLYKEEPLGHAPCQPKAIGNKHYCARIVITGVKRADSRARSQRWSQSYIKIFKRKNSIDIAVAPLADMTDSEVWALLQHYGIRNIVEKQYKKWKRAPNCVLCPLASKTQLSYAAKQLPATYVNRFIEALETWDTTIAKRIYKILKSSLEEASKI